MIAVQCRTGALIAGFRERLSHTVVDGSDCLVISRRASAPACLKLVALSHLLTFGAREGGDLHRLDTETGLDVSVGDATLAPGSPSVVALSLALELGLACFSIGRDRRRGLPW